MGIEQDVATMVRAALPEYIQLARAGVEKGGLGYPTATLLFAVIDAIASYHQKHPTFKVLVEGEEVGIPDTDRHFRILNSKYFGEPNGLGLTREQIKRVYSRARCPVTHNASLGRGVMLFEGANPERPIFDKDGWTLIHLPSFLDACETAVSKFFEVSDSMIPASAIGQWNLNDLPAEWQEQAARLADLMKEAWGSQVSVTGMGSTSGARAIPPQAGNHSQTRTHKRV